MPRVVRDDGFGGVSGRKRQRYTARQSRGILAMARHMQHAEGISLRSAALRLGVSQSLLSRWSRRHSMIGDVAFLRKKSVCLEGGGRRGRVAPSCVYFFLVAGSDLGLG